MTTIAGLVTPEGRTFLAAERQSTSGDDNRSWTRTTPKLIDGAAPMAETTVGRRTRAERDRHAQPFGEYVMGVTGPSSLIDFLRYDWTTEATPDPDDDQDCDRWARAVAQAFTEWAVEGQPVVLEGGHLDAIVVIAYAGRLWRAVEHGAARIAPWPSGWALTGVGSGGEYATGALSAYIACAGTPDYDPEAPLEAEHSPAGFLRGAVRIASEHDPFSGGGHVDVVEV